jgi:glycosyltransferase involved in cell wall biosynthesis
MTLVSEVAIALLIELRPQSVNFRRYAQQMGVKTALELCLEAIQECAPSSPSSILLLDEGERKRVEQSAKGCNIDVFCAETATDLTALLRFAEHTQAPHVAVVSLEYLLAPRDLLVRTIQHHLRHGNDLTTVEGMPSTVTPIILRSSFLSELLQLNLPGLAANYRSTVKVLKSLLAAESETGFSFRFEPLDARTAYKCSNALLPHAVVIESAADVAIAASAVEQAAITPASSSPLALLDAWRIASIQAHENHKAQVHAEPSALAGRSAGPLTVLYVSNSAGFSGAEESLCQLVRKIPETDFRKFALISLEGELTKQLREATARVICPNRDFSAQTIDNLAYLCKVCERIKPHIIHLNGFDGFPVLAVSHFLNIPLIVHARNGVIEPYEQYARAAARIIAVSNFIRRQILSLGIAPEKISVIYDEVDPTAFRAGMWKKSYCRQALGLPQDGRLAVMIARFAPNKRHDLIIRAAAILKSRIPGYHLVLKGEIYESSNYFQSVQERINQAGIADTVTIIPFVPDIRMLHAAADVVVLCSDHEGLGRCIVEAMAMEVPVVVTDSGGTHEIVVHEKTGLVVPSNDPEALAVAIERFLTDERLSAQCAKEGREFASTHLTSDISASAVQNLYAEVVQANLPRMLASAG